MVNNIYILTIIIGMFITILLLIGQNSILKIKNINLSNELFQKEIDHTNQLEFLLNKINSEEKEIEEEVKEGFVNFLNQSRDWAFEYIEKVQKTLKEFVNVADRKMNYAEKYHDIDPWQETLVQLIEPYKKLKALLPEEEQDNASKRQG